jgi:hypothetical protein
MRDKSTPDAGLTPFLWVGAVLLFIITEAQIIVSTFTYRPSTLGLT